MADAHLQADLEESKQEIRRLRERLYLGTPTVHKDLSLVSLVPKWSGAQTQLGHFIMDAPNYTEDVTWQRFKSVFNQRFKDVHSDQYHFIKLQTARQGKNESPRELPTDVVDYLRKFCAK